MKSLWTRIWRFLQLIVPFGLLVRTKPRHYREMLRILWQNRGRWRYAWRVLNHGVCDGCSLGPRGLRDDVIEGTHLCLTRLKLLRLTPRSLARCCRSGCLKIETRLSRSDGLLRLLARPHQRGLLRGAEAGAAR